MKRKLSIALFLTAALLPAETTQERGKRIVDECLDALGGKRYLNMENRVESGRAYSFYRDQLTGLSIAKIYTRYESDVKDTGHQLAQRVRQNFGKKEDFGVLFAPDEAYDITFRGARPLAADRFVTYKETTLRDVFYILRARFHEPGMIFDSRGSEVIENSPVNIVDITDADNRTTTVYFHQLTKLPTRQVFYRRDAVTKDKIEEITRFSKYRDAGGGVQWPYAIERERNGEKTYEIFSESVQINDSRIESNLFALPSSIKLLRRE